VSAGATSPVPGGRKLVLSGCGSRDFLKIEDRRRPTDERLASFFDSLSLAPWGG